MYDKARCKDERKKDRGKLGMRGRGSVSAIESSAGASLRLGFRRAVSSRGVLLRHGVRLGASSMHASASSDVQNSATTTSATSVLRDLALPVGPASPSRAFRNELATPEGVSKGEGVPSQVDGARLKTSKDRSRAARMLSSASANKGGTKAIVRFGSVDRCCSSSSPSHAATGVLSLNSLPNSSGFSTRQGSQRRLVAFFRSPFAARRTRVPARSPAPAMPGGGAASLCQMYGPGVPPCLVPSLSIGSLSSCNHPPRRRPFSAVFRRGAWSFVSLDRG